jgi:lipoprotein-releasing system ATP-binding protein
MYKFVIALRYIRSRLITIFSILAVALGVMVLVVVLAVMDGFKKEFVFRLQGSLSHIIMTVRTPEYNYSDIEKKVITAPHVVACSPHLNGLVLIGTGRYYAGGMVIGIDYDKEQQVGKLDEYLVSAYKEHKLCTEELLEDNVRRIYREKLSWQVLGAQRATGNTPLTRVICQETREYVSNDDTPNKFQPYRRFVAYTIDNYGKVVLLEPDLPNEVKDNMPALPQQEMQSWQAYFDNLAKLLDDRDLPGYLAHFSPHMKNSAGCLDLSKPLEPLDDDRPLLMGYELMRQLGLKRGDPVSLMTGTRDKDGKLQAVSRKFIVVGAFKSGWQEIDVRLVYARRSDLLPDKDDPSDKGFLDVTNDVSEICVALDDPQHADKTKKHLEKTLNDVPFMKKFIIERWEDRRRTLLAAIRLERNIMAIILSLIVILAVATIMIILILMVSQKVKDIGILKAMGAADNGIMGIFVSNGFFISLFGSIIGTVAGISFALNINWVADLIYENTGFRVFPRDVYYLDQIPCEISYPNIAVIVVVTLVLSLLACLIPALKAARMDVVEALNSEVPSLRWWHRLVRDTPIPDKARNAFFYVDNVTREYVMGPHTLRILQGIKLEVQRGEILAIVGTSGAGKSTLLHIMGLLDTPTEGTVYLNGQNLHLLPRNAQACVRNINMGFIFQFYHLLPEFSALENVLMASLIRHSVWTWPYSKRAEQARAAELLYKVGLGERLIHLPRELSGGERQRVAIARALMNEPQIVFCDEPTGNLDEKNAQAIQELLWDLSRQLKQTFVIVTHQENMAKNADSTFRLEHGILSKGL